MLRKSTYSTTSTSLAGASSRFSVANVFRQDLIWKGYTGELSFLADFDNNRRHYDKKVSHSRGLRQSARSLDHYVQAYYLGWTGDGHIG